MTIGLAFFFGFSIGTLTPFILGILIVKVEEYRQERSKEEQEKYLNKNITDVIKKHFDEGRDKSI